MSKLEELIKKLCPNGVEYKYIEDIVTIEKGKQLNKTLLSNSGKYPVINGGITPSGYWDEYNYNEGLITISQGGASAGFVNYIKTKFWAGAHCYVVSKVKEGINYRYIYHFLKYKEVELQNFQVGAGIPSVSLQAIKKLYLAVPPIEVQNEIVRILDNFTELEAKLEAELEAELEARKKQYEYYKNKMFKFDRDIKYFPLKEVCITIKDGMHNLPKDNSLNGEYPILSAQNINNGKISFDAKRYVSKEIYDRENKRINLEKNDVLLTIVATIGRTAVINENNKILLQRSVCALKPNEKIHAYYLKYYLETNKVQEYMARNAHGSAQSGLYLNQVSEIQIPVPTLEEQEKIVNILDGFDELCNDISEGLQAELEARRKQYEYYRDKLLNFKELKVENKE